MEEHSSHKNCKSLSHNLDPNDPKWQELFRRFEGMSKWDRDALINSISTNKRTTEESQELYEALLGLLNSSGKVPPELQRVYQESEDVEEEEEEDEESDNDSDCCNSCEKGKSSNLF